MNVDIYSTGWFDNRVVIEEPVEATGDSFGQTHYGPAAPQGEWGQVIECWAHIAPQWGQEIRQSGKELSEAWAAIQIRYGSGVGRKTVTPKMRVRHKKTGALWDIRTVMHIDSARKVIELTCLLIQ